MRSKKKDVLNELKKSEKLLNLNTIRAVNTAKSNYDIAMSLLDADYVEIFARTFSPSEIKNLWQEWTRHNILLFTGTGFSGSYSDEKYEAQEEKLKEYRKKRKIIRNVLIERMKTSKLSAYEVSEFKKVIRYFK